MNKEEFLGKRYAIDLKLKELNGEKEQLEKEYIESNQVFPIGSKVCITVPAHERILVPEAKKLAYIADYDIDEVTSDDYNIHKQGGKYLSEAVQWFMDNNIPLFGINENPEQHTWTLSPKPYCHIYIDDAALGCPLKYDVNLSNRPFVDWMEVENTLIKRGLIKTGHHTGEMPVR